MLNRLKFVSIALLMAATPATAEDSKEGLAGLWRFDVTSPQGTTLGAMTVRKREQGYSGKLITNQGDEALDIRSIELQGTAMTMVVASPRGDVVFRGNLSDGRYGFSGTVTYFNGQSFPMVGAKQRACEC